MSADKGWNNDEIFTISAYHLLIMRRKGRAELLLLLVSLLNVGIFSATVIDSPVFRSKRQCVGRIKTYQVKIKIMQQRVRRKKYKFKKLAFALLSFINCFLLPLL